MKFIISILFLISVLTCITNSLILNEERKNINLFFCVCSAFISNLFAILLIVKIMGE